MVSSLGTADQGQLLTSLKRLKIKLARSQSQTSFCGGRLAGS